jgi:hypothetical protein
MPEPAGCPVPAPPHPELPAQHLLHVMVELTPVCNACIYSCLCASHLAALQGRQGEIRYQFRQCSVCFQS